jgi:hypothetical protein
MAFYGDVIIFNGISSEDYGLYVMAEDGDETTSILEFDSDITKPTRQSKFSESEQYVSDPKSFTITLYSKTSLSQSDIDNIYQWLYSTDGEYKTLIIDQADMENYHFNCRLQQFENETYGNKIYKIHITMQCDSIYAWEDEITLTYTDFTSAITFVNSSSENTMKPTYEITCNASSGAISIVDDFYSTSIKNTMAFTELLSGEVLTIDTEHNIITSDSRDTGTLDLFTSPKFLRLDRGTHNFTVTGDISQLKITYTNARVIGG